MAQASDVGGYARPSKPQPKPPRAPVKEPAKIHEDWFNIAAPVDMPDIFKGSLDELQTQGVPFLTPSPDSVREDAGIAGLGMPADVRRITTKRYNSMSDQQRAAVDFNTALFQAVRRDERNANRGLYNDVTSSELEKYKTLEKEMFGENSDTGHYPETLRLLSQTGIDNEKLSLTDFTDLSAAVSAKDLRTAFEPSKDAMTALIGDMAVAPDSANRRSLARALADKTLGLQKTLAGQGSLTRGFSRSAAAAGGSLVTELGGVAPGVGPGFGPAKTNADGSADLNAVFQYSFEKLADKASGNDVNAYLGLLGDQLSPEQFSQFLHYADIRSRAALQYGTPLGNSAQIQYRTPEAFRKLLGLGGSK